MVTNLGSLHFHGAAVIALILGFTFYLPISANPVRMRQCQSITLEGNGGRCYTNDSMSSLGFKGAAVCFFPTELMHKNTIIYLQILRKYTVPNSHTHFSEKQCYSQLFYFEVCLRVGMYVFVLVSVIYPNSISIENAACCSDYWSQQTKCVKDC